MIKELFEEGDIAGDKLFWFQTPKRKDGMAAKASESAKKASDQAKLSTTLRRCPTPNSKDASNLKTPLKKTPRKKNGSAKDKENQQQIVLRSKTPYRLRTRLKRRK